MTMPKRFTTTDAKAIRKLLVYKGQRVRIDVGYRETEQEGDWDADINNWKRLPNGDYVDLSDIDCITNAHRSGNIVAAVKEGTRLDLYIYDYETFGFGHGGEWELRGNTEVIWNGSEWVVGSYEA
jgi:hypothetical protein